ncbi:hypothetical protein VKT23_019506 [Stygiomarasmius scandens]|uniref:Uncharacterized protein n=1 Tax=Marasmiellus scandens TaxID=2682957 RepID=A0ABR1ILV1_9AGAR
MSTKLLMLRLPREYLIATSPVLSYSTEESLAPTSPAPATKHSTNASPTHQPGPGHELLDKRAPHSY